MRGELAPLKAPGPDRGDAIELDPSQVQPITLLLHELVANAHRHGALSVAEGGLSIAWGSDPTARELRITWRRGPSSYAGQVTRLGPDDDRGHHQ